MAKTVVVVMEAGLFFMSIVTLYQNYYDYTIEIQEKPYAKLRVNFHP